MRLWTWHEPDFSLTSGCVNHTRSEYYNTVQGAPEAYAELAKRLGTDKVIWCCVRRDQYLKSPVDTRIEWVLDVPDDRILAIIDAYIWNKILGEKAYPRSLEGEWYRRAPKEEAARDAYIQQQIEDYHSQPPPDGGWWTQLFIADTDAEGANVLLRHPIPQSWVVSVARGPV